MTEEDERPNVIESSINLFWNYVETKRVYEKGAPFTHTRVGKPPKSGKYNIEDGFDHQYFLKLYKNVYNEIDLNFSEKQKEIGPLNADFDFRFDRDHRDRMYTTEDLEYVVGIMNEVIMKYIDVPKKKIMAYVFEKQKPSFDENKDNYKDGFHICYIMPFSVEQRYFLFDRVKSKIFEDGGFTHLKYINKYDEVFDVSTIATNNWMMYGSKKTGSQKYTLTHIYEHNGNELPLETLEGEDLVMMFSVRQFDEDECVFYNRNNVDDDILDEVRRKYIKKVKKAKTPDHIHVNKGELIVDEDETESEMEGHYERKIRKNGEDVKLARLMVQILSADRANGYNDWIRVGWALHNIDKSLLKDFIEFSKKCPDKFDKSKCDDIWNTARDNGYTLASLCWWARQDNLTKYNEIMSANIHTALIQAIDCQHTDLANVIYELYKCYFRCASIKENIWFEFQKHRWVNVQKGYTLLNIMSGNELKKEFSDLQFHYMNKARDAQGSIAEDWIVKSNAVNKVLKNLKNRQFKESVLSECACLFYDKEFETKLNSNRDLIGFNNGVFDLRTNTFREGTPDDYISFTTGYDYVELNDGNPLVIEVNKFIGEIMRETNMKEYLMRFISSCLEGHIREQKFVFWTGTGCHSPNTEIMMYNGEAKYAKNIAIGDRIMGDDSRARRVCVLYNGEQDMFEIRLDDGSYYEANRDHRIALKSTYNGDVIWNSEYNAYIVTYHCYLDDIPIKREKSFIVRNIFNANEKEAIHHMALQYLENKLHKPKTIRCGDIIPITVNDYLALDYEVKRYYKCFKSVVEFEKRDIPTDPYKVGMSIETGNVPSMYMFNTHIVRETFLAGIIDKFGSIDEQNGLILTINDPILLKDIIFMLNTLGFKLNKIAVNKIVVMGKITFLPIKKLIISDKYNKLDEFLYDFTINPIGRGKFYGFGVDGNERYVLHNSVVTYNCNGKTTLDSLIKLTFGDYYDVLDMAVFTTRRNTASSASPEIVNKIGKRCIIMNEPEGDETFYVAKMKEYTGGGTITGRGLYKDQISFKPQWKFVVCCNDLPPIPSIDGGTWRRIVVVPFETKFVDYEPKLKHEIKIDKMVENKLPEWKQAFVWLLLKKYYVKFVKEGLKEPEKVLQYTKNYRSDSDVIMEFITQNLELTKNEDDILDFRSMFDGFREWYKSSYARSNNVCTALKDIRAYFVKNNYNVIGSALVGAKFKDFEKIDGKKSGKSVDDVEKI